MAAAALSIIAAASLTAGLRGDDTPLDGALADPLPGPTTSRLAPPPTAADGNTVTPAVRPSVPASVTPSGAGPVAVRSAPVELRIPAIDVAVSLSSLGLNPDGTVEVPTDFHEPGWFQPGPAPGQVGSAVILGHVDSHEGPAVFYRLRSLRAGDRIEVSRADGSVAHFVVDAIAMYPKEEFPAREVYASPGYSALQLVTCGGEFDSDSGHYQSNVVAYTSLVRTTPAAL